MTYILSKLILIFLSFICLLLLFFFFHFLLFIVLSSIFLATKRILIYKPKQFSHTLWGKTSNPNTTLSNRFSYPSKTFLNLPLPLFQNSHKYLSNSMAGLLHSPLPPPPQSVLVLSFLSLTNPLSISWFAQTHTQMAQTQTQMAKT